MPSKRCLVKSCKHPAKRIFKIPNSDVVGNNVWTLWMNVVDPDRRNIGGPYGICSSHFSGIYYLFLIFFKHILPSPSTRCDFHNFGLIFTGQCTVCLKG